MDTIDWNRSFPGAENAAFTEDKGILLDFFNPDSVVCQQMDRDTYSHKKVKAFIAEHLQPYRADNPDEPYFERYNIIWTPTLVFLDKLGRENHRSVGYLGPADFFATGMLALGKIYSSNGNFAAAQYHFDKVLKDYPHSLIAEETLFYIGVTRYRQTKNPVEFKKVARILQKDYPTGSWTRKAEPYLIVTESQTL